MDDNSLVVGGFQQFEEKKMFTFLTMVKSSQPEIQALSFAWIKSFAPSVANRSPKSCPTLSTGNLNPKCRTKESARLQVESRAQVRTSPRWTPRLAVAIESLTARTLFQF
jgi:hypothetical protein